LVTVAAGFSTGVIDEFGHSEVVEMVDISGCEVEVSDEIIAEECTDQQLIQQEIKEEELEDAEHSVDLSQQGKRLLLKVDLPRYFLCCIKADPFINIFYCIQITYIYAFFSISISLMNC